MNGRLLKWILRGKRHAANSTINRALPAPSRQATLCRQSLWCQACPPVGLVARADPGSRWSNDRASGGGHGLNAVLNRWRRNGNHPRWESINYRRWRSGAAAASDGEFFGRRREHEGKTSNERAEMLPYPIPNSGCQPFLEDLGFVSFDSLAEGFANCQQTPCQLSTFRDNGDRVRSHRCLWLFEPAFVDGHRQPSGDGVNRSSRSQWIVMDLRWT